MSCYFRHMKDVFEEAGVEPKSCSPAWKAVKEPTRGGEESRLRFVEELRRRLP